MKILAATIKLNLEANNGKISPDFIDNLAENADNEEIGNRVAFNNAKNQLWSTCGSIAKII